MGRRLKEDSKIGDARAAYWACNLSFISGKSYTDLEREITPWAVKKRDGGGYTQPHAFRKYSLGIRWPDPKGKRSPVLIAEKLYPGSIKAYNSILWDVAKIEIGSKVDLREIYNRTNSEVIAHLENGFFSKKSPPLLNEYGKYEVRFLGNIDAFALLLLTLRYDEQITVGDINDLQSWLLLNIEINPFAMCSDILLNIFEEVIPEVGVMTGPRGFILDNKNRHLNSFTSALMSGRIIK